MFENLLGSLGDMALPDYAAPVNQAVARNDQLRQQMPAKKPFSQSKFGQILGMIGDALLAHNGRAPMYSPQMRAMEEKARQEQANSAIANYLGQLDPALAGLIMSAGPEAGMQAYGLTHPKPGGKPSFVEEFEYREGLDPDRQKRLDAYAERRKFNPYASPITLGPNDTFEDGSGGGGEVTATGPNGEKIRLNPSTGQWEPVGGPTATPSAVFQ